MVHDLEIDPPRAPDAGVEPTTTGSAAEGTPAAPRVPPHARAAHERARKLQDLPLVDLGARVAEGLARLRGSFGLQARDPDPLRALLASLPRTELARRATELAAELASARALVLERERAAADVERRSESLKEALRERSADLAVALARAEAGAGAQRELESVRGALAALEAARAQLAPDLEQAASERVELARSVLDASEARAAGVRHVAELDKDALLARASALAAEIDAARDARARDGAELARLRGELERERAARRAAESALDASRAALSREAEILERELAWRRREMEALRAAAGGLGWKLLGGGARERIARWEQGERP
ncbi:MAG: hypothetical protein JNK02_07020 [Planctomycetes bacterium]|nr:hypothetical protein [Planctomycetota bacterium]